MDLGDGVKVVVVAEQKGPELVSEKEIVAKLGAVTGPIERLGRDVLDAAKRVKPEKTTVELGWCS
jgi:hypothetical protein